MTTADLEPKLRYLADNQYRSVASDDIAAFARGERTLPPRAVALCFDDAWASLWTVAGPLLRQYGLTAIAYAIPGRTEEAPACRPTLDAGAADASAPPLATWAELAELHSTGLVDVQCHTLSHRQVFTSPAISDFVRPGYDLTPMLNRPEIAAGSRRFVSPADLGAPLLPSRSRMSDAPQHSISLAVYDRCVETVARSGGAAFFDAADWRSTLERAAGDVRAEPEADAAQDRDIDRELDEGRSLLQARLKTRVDHVCLPWGVAGRKTADAVKRLGFRSAIANRLRGMHAVRPGDDPYWLKRLPNKYIFRLPGRGRRWW